MTREEQINKIAEDYTEIECGLKLKLEEDWTVDDIITAFINGAKWADKNPKSHWINVKDDLPCNHEELLDSSCEYNETVIVLTACGNSYFLNWMELDRNGEWVWHSIKNVTHWMKLPELPKE